MRTGNRGALILRAVLGAALAMLVQASAARADAAGDAVTFCSAMNETNLLSSPCSVSASDSAVDVSVAMSASEARGLCDTVPATLAKLGVTFEKGWTMRVHSPDGTITTCNLE